MFVVLVIQHAVRMRVIILFICGMSGYVLFFHFMS